MNFEEAVKELQLGKKISVPAHRTYGRVIVDSIADLVNVVSRRWALDDVSEVTTFSHVATDIDLIRYFEQLGEDASSEEASTVARRCADALRVRLVPLDNDTDE